MIKTRNDRQRKQITATYDDRDGKYDAWFNLIWYGYIIEFYFSWRTNLCV